MQSKELAGMSYWSKQEVTAQLVAWHSLACDVLITFNLLSVALAPHLMADEYVWFSWDVICIW